MVESHEYLLTISSIEDAQAERKHSSHEVVAIAVHRLALWVVESQRQLYRHTDGHQSYGKSPMAAIDEEAIDDIELQHQTKEPEGTWPNDVVGFWQYIVEHAEHRHDVEEVILVCSRRDGIEHRESHESHNHHLEELQIMITDELQRLSPVEGLFAIDTNKLCGIL